MMQSEIQYSYRGQGYSVTIATTSNTYRHTVIAHKSDA